MAESNDELKVKKINNEAESGGDANVGSAGIGSESSSTTNDFFLVNDGDGSGSSGGSASASASVTRLACGTDGDGQLELELSEAARESEDNRSTLSTQDSRSNAEPTSNSEKKGDVDLVGLLIGQSEDEMANQVDSTYLHGVTFLGCSRVDLTQGYQGALDVMLVLKRQGMSAVPVTLVVPANSTGHLRLIYTGTDEAKFKVPVRNIACCTRGTVQEIQDCLGFVVIQPQSHSSNPHLNASTGTSSSLSQQQDNSSPTPTDNYLCYVVQFASLETLSAALSSFSQAFGMNSMPPGGLHAVLGEEHLLLVQFTVSVKEGEVVKQTQNSHSDTELKFTNNVPRDKTCLKLRQSVLKKVEIAVKVVSEPQLIIERTCGFFVQFDDNPISVKSRSYELLDHLDSSLRYYSGGREVVSSGIMDPELPQFLLFNSLTGKAGLLYVRFALDVVFAGIESPVRFHLPMVCKVMAKNERFFYPNRRPLLVNYIVNLKAVPDTDSSYRVEGLKCESESERNKSSISSTAGSFAGSLFGINNNSQNSYHFSVDDDLSAEDPQFSASAAEYLAGSESDSLNLMPPGEDDDSTDDVLLSGYGSVSKDCSEEVLEKWDQVLKEWKDTSSPVSSPAVDSPSIANTSFSFGSAQKGRPQPKKVRHLIRSVGIPEALRAEVWLRQVGTEDSEELCEKYRHFLSQEFVNEDQIKRDIHRTFPANDFFKDDQGPGQEALLKIAKAYAQYDQEVGYCQGFTYIAAVLLLHMPEEQAFCVFVRLMGLFKLRELYKQDFNELKLKWYQLDNLLKDNAPTLYYHFHSIGLKAHMFSSQWFLTLFTAKFPLYLVYRIYDIIFCEGLSFLLNVGVVLLRESSEELCRKSFEECNTYIKANIPRKYREEAAADDLIRKALQMKINPKKLSQYAKEYYEIVQREERMKDPMERLKLEQQETHSKIMALEAEAVNLANELVNAKMDSQRKLETLEEKVSQIQSMFERTHQELAEMQEQKQNLESEVEQLREVASSKTKDVSQQKDIVSEYRRLCSRLEGERDHQTQLLQQLKDAVSECANCKGSLNALMSSDDPDGSQSTESETQDASQRSSKATRTSHVTNVDSLDSFQMEQELALTKLRLVEEQSHNQQLEHEVAELKHMISAMSASAANQTASSATQWLLKRTPQFLSRGSTGSVHSHQEIT